MFSAFVGDQFSFGNPRCRVCTGLYDTYLLCLFGFYFAPDRADSAGRADGTGASHRDVLSREQTLNPLRLFQVLAAHCGTIPRRPEQPGTCLLQTVDQVADCPRCDVKSKSCSIIRVCYILFFERQGLTTYKFNY